jgi:kynurenine formamidase
MRQSILFLLLCFVLNACATRPGFPSGKIIDLSHSFDEETVYWPTEKGFVLEKEFEGITDKGYFYAANQFSAAEHGGTHVDAPKHFSEKGKTVDEIPLERLMGQGILVDVSGRCSADRDYQIGVEDFLDWEKGNGKIPEGAIVFLKTGFGKYWPDRSRYMGTDERGKGAVKKLHFPGLHPEAARWLARSREIRAVGIDTPSIDYGQSVLFESHVALFDKNIPALENLANLEELPAKNFWVIAFPMKIKKGSGGPTRVAAIV